MNKLPWFTHDNNARHDLFITQLEDKFGHFGYASYFKILEMLHQHGIGDKLTIPKAKLCQELRSRWTKVRLLLNFCSTSGKVEFNSSSTQVQLQIKKFIERQRKMRRNSNNIAPSTGPQLPLEGEVEGEREVKAVVKTDEQQKQQPDSSKAFQFYQAICKSKGKPQERSEFDVFKSRIERTLCLLIEANADPIEFLNQRALSYKKRKIDNWFIPILLVDAEDLIRKNEDAEHAALKEQERIGA